MKTIGIIGGLGPPSTIKYYEGLTSGIKERTGGQAHGAQVIINSVNGAEIAGFRAAEDDEGEGAFFVDQAKRLERAGADCILIASNTSHKNAPYIQKEISLPLIHLAQATADVIVEAGLQKVILLGTAKTMEGDFYRQYLDRAGLKIIVPDAEDRAFINESIYMRLVKNLVTDDDNARYAAIIKQLVEAHDARGVILGCTELTLLDMPSRVDVPLFDTVQIHVNAALDFALS